MDVSYSIALRFALQRDQAIHRSKRTQADDLADERRDRGNSGDSSNRFPVYSYVFGCISQHTSLHHALSSREESSAPDFSTALSYKR